MSQDSVLETVHQAGVEVPKGSQGVFDLPCGYLDPEGVLHREVQVREITGYEEDMMSSKSVPDYKKGGLLIAGCLQRVGTITDPRIIAEIPSKLLVGDRTFLVFAIRRATYGDSYPFRDECPKCSYNGIFSLDLGELEIKTAPDPTKRLFELDLPSGLKVKFHPLTGAEEETLFKSRGKEEAISLSMLARLDVMGDKAPTLRDVQGLVGRDRAALREAFDAVEGGINTSLEMQCPSCSEEFDRELDVAQAGFFSPSQVLKDSKKKSST